MDMLPPQAPPAVTHTQNQETRDAAQRLVEVQDWLLQQNGLLPTPPAATAPADLEPYLAALADFWRMPVPNAPGAPDAPRAAVFASRLAGAMKDEALLRHLDGTLDVRAKDLAASFARSHGQPLPSHVHASELVFGNVAYAGAVIVTDDRAADIALLFSPARGWEAFDSLDALYRDTEARTRRSMAAEESLPGMTADDLDNVVNQAFVTSRPIDGPVFERLVERIVEVQADHATAAWAGADDRTDDAPASAMASGATERAAGLAYDMGLHHYLDIHAIVAARNERLNEAIAKEQLAYLPPDAQAAWRRAKAAYAAEQYTAEATLRRFDVDPVMPLGDFARDRLAAMLADKGITTDPRRIAVDVYPAPVSPVSQALNPIPALGLWLVSPSPDTRLETTTLPELALRNVAPLDGLSLRARSDDGQDLTPQLHPQALPGIIRDLDIAGQYRDYLLGVLDSSPEGQLRHVVSTTLRQKRMRLELEDARLGDHQPDAVRAFRFDRNQRGYEWVRAVLDAPDASTRATVEGHAIVVRQLMYKGEPVKDVLVIAAAQPQAVPNMVIYTPDAPDGRAFREFRDGAAADAEFFYNTRFEQYLIDRLPLDLSEPLPNGAGRRFRIPYGDSLAQWVFSQRDRSGTRTAEPFEERVVAGNFLDALHDASLALASRNLSSFARSTREAQADAMPRLDVEAVGRSVSWFLGRPFQAAWRAYDGVKAGDFAGAFVDGTQAYVASLDYLGAGPLASRAIVPLVGRVSRQSAHLVPLGGRVRSADVIHESRFIAREVSARNASSVDNGIYTIGDGQYIAQGEHMYGVRFDSQRGTWRLHRPGSGPTSYGPPITRDTSGAWIRDESFGLLGGMDRPARRALLDDQQGRHLSAWQLHVAAHTMVRQVGAAETVAIALILRERGRAGLSHVQLQALVRAIARGRAAPGIRPLPANAVQANAAASAPPALEPRPGPSRPPAAPQPAPGRPTVPGESPPQTEPLDLSMRRPVYRNLPEEPALFLRQVEEVAPEQWPDFLWYRSEIPRDSGHRSIILSLSRQPHVLYPGIRLQATTPAGMAASAPPPGQPYHWVQLNMRFLRQDPPFGTPLRVTRITEPAGTYYVLSRPDDRYGSAFYLSLPRGSFIERW